MTVVLIQNIKSYIGVSTDTKPTLANSDAGSKFYEIDTNDYYIWTGSFWMSYVSVEIPPYPEIPDVPAVEVGGIARVLTTDAAMRELFEEILVELKKVNFHLYSMTEEEITDDEIMEEI